MYTKNNYERYISVIIKQDISYQTNKDFLDYTLVKEEDSLFWSFYIIVFGMDKYIMNKGKNYDIQQKIKIGAIESMNDNKSILKQYKLTKSVIEQNLLYDSHISYSSFLYLTMYYKKNIIIVDDRVYYECIGNPDDSEIVMLKKIKHHYAIYSKPEKDYAVNYYKIINVGKPILSISSYKLIELQDICNKLKLEIDGKKKDLYERIVKCIN
tara:strand:- start:1593 stop:2225 length:633 start_codon:yes stop_codon:yes gene_type:complete